MIALRNGAHMLSSFRPQDGRWASWHLESSFSHRGHVPALHVVSAHILYFRHSATNACVFSASGDPLESPIRWCDACGRTGGRGFWFNLGKDSSGCGSHEVGVKRLLRTRAMCGASRKTSVLSSSKDSKGFASKLLDVPRSVWRQIVTPLSNFGFGKRSLWEGGVGLFIISGIVLLAATLSWLKTYRVRSGTQTYQAVVEFSKASGISAGTPVRIRGVEVGSVVSVKLSLESIDAVFQVLDAHVVIPRNSLVEVNQSGLLMETLIDITPRYPIPQPTVGPLHPHCAEEGLIVCDRQRIKGGQGANLDELVWIVTKLSREIDAIGIREVYSLADQLGATVEEAKPLLAKVEALAGGIEPLLKEAQDSGLLKEFQKLAKVLTEVSLDLRKLNSSVLTPQNTELLRQSVATLTETLKNIENISKDVS
eukprot:c26644_g1_i1 orf=255-1526(+)